MGTIKDKLRMRRVEKENKGLMTEYEIDKMTESKAQDQKQ